MGNTFYNRTTILSKVFIITFFVSINLFGQKNVRIGFLDLDLVLNNNNDYITANQELESKINIWRTEIENRQKEILGKKESLKIESTLLTNELIEERIEDIKYDEDLLNTYIDKRFGVEGDWIKEKVLLSQPAQDEILIAIREIAADRKLDYVFDSSADILVLHSEKKYDISDLVIRYLEIKDKKEAKKFLNDSKNEENNKKSNPKAEQRRVELQKLKEERLQKIEERKKKKVKSKNLEKNTDSISNTNENKKEELEKTRQEKLLDIKKRKEEQKKLIQERKKKRLEELEKRRKEIEEK
ncbi:MAG: OmpH family outer membrane protein, partial [Bacteroidota bacterium]|nr:OmpH family outer membrane protein [Bacteroidota bacterium]